MSEGRDRQPDEIERELSPDGVMEERFRFGPYLIIRRTRTVEVEDPHDGALLRELDREYWRVNAHGRTIAVLDGRLDPHEAASWARERLLGRLR